MSFIFVVFLSFVSLVGACVEYSECKLPDGRVGLCYEKSCLSQVNEDQRDNLTFTVRVKYPETVLKNHGRTSLFIRGNGLGLLWIKGKQLSNTGYDTWEVNVTYRSSLTGYQCQSCLNNAYLPENKFQYRILADDRDNMLGANFVINFPISKSSSYFDVKPVYTSYPWFYEQTGVVSSFVINSTFIGNERNITLYTPPSFSENSYKTYPTIFVFDLSLRFAKFFKKNFEGPIYPNAISEEYALIGFGDYKNDGKERVDLLTQTVGPYLDCINGSFADNCNGCIPVDFISNRTGFYRHLEDGCGKRSIVGGLGDNTLDFLEKEALPFASKLSLRRLQTNNLGIMGYSLGGLMSCYAVWTRSHVYSFAACQSPSLWWPFNNLSMYACDFDFMNKTLKTPIFQTKRPDQKIYLDAGGYEILDPYRLTQSTVEAAHKITAFKHYSLDKNVWVDIDPYKNHTYVEWGKRMGQALATLLPADGSPRMPSNDASPVG